MKETEEEREAIAQHNHELHIERLKNQGEEGIPFLIMEEIKEQSPLINSIEIGGEVGGTISRWIQTRNPLYVDRALLICHQNNEPPPPTLVKVVADVARQRLDGLVSKGARKIAKEDVQSRALILMLNLINVVGETDAIASKKAAQWIVDNEPGIKPITAGYLSRKYSETWRKSGNERLIIEVIKELTPEQIKCWKEISDSLPIAFGELEGARHR